MGTFTKSFGSAGGYVAGGRALIAHLRRHSPAHLHATSIAPGAAQQVRDERAAAARQAAGELEAVRPGSPAAAFSPRCLGPGAARGQVPALDPGRLPAPSYQPRPPTAS
jgi:hypothetical protein